MKGFIYRNGITHFTQIACNRKTCRTSAYHRYFFIFILIYFYVDIAVFCFVIRRKAFKISYSYGRGILSFAYRANFLALVFLRADPAAYCRQRIRFFNFLCGAEKISFFDKLYKSGNIYINGASFDAVRSLALNTSFCFFYGFFGRISVRDLFEIAVPYRRRLTLHNMFLNFQPFFCIHI